MKLRVGVMGAGAIGCYVGGLLAAHGCEVTFVGRERTKRELETSGLTLVDLGGATTRVPSPVVHTSPEALAHCDATLCCVKSGATRETGEALARVLPSGALVVSLQNGVSNADVLRTAAPKQRVLGGIVGFNVVAEGATFRRATSGLVVIEDLADGRLGRLARKLREARFELEIVRDIAPVQWSKLVMNLANAIGALSGAPTRDILLDEGYRRVVRAVMREAVDTLAAARMPLARLGPLPVQLFPVLLGLPTPLFRVVTKAQLEIDPQARSSMWQDLDRRRDTEVEELNGEIARLAQSHGLAAPINARVVSLVHEVAARREGSPNLSPRALAEALGV